MKTMKFKWFFVISIILLTSLKIFPQESEETIRIKTQKFRATKDKIIFLSKTEIEKGDTRIIADHMELQLHNGEERFVKVTEGVYVELKEGTVTSQEMDYDLKTEKGVMRKNVKAVFHPKDSKDTVQVKCETLNVNLKDKIFYGKTDGGKVTIKKGNMFIQGKSFNYDSDKALLTVEGDVFVDDKDKNRKMWAQKIVMDINEDTIDAQDAQLEIVIETKK